MFQEEILKPASFAITTRLFSLILGLMLTLPAAHAFGQNIHQLNYDNEGWIDTNLTALAGGVSASYWTAAFYTTPNDELQVYYSAASDNHIHKMYSSTGQLPGGIRI